MNHLTDSELSGKNLDVTPAREVDSDDGVGGVYLLTLCVHLLCAQILGSDTKQIQGQCTDTNTDNCNLQMMR